MGETLVAATRIPVLVCIHEQCAYICVCTRHQLIFSVVALFAGFPEERKVR